MTTTALTLDEIHALAYDALTGNGADHENASALARTIMTAERDGSVSHGCSACPPISARSGQARPMVLHGRKPSVFRVTDPR